MNLQKYNIQELERFIEEIQKKILVFNENLKDGNLTEKETIRIKEQLLTHKNLMSYDSKMSNHEESKLDYIMNK